MGRLAERLGVFVASQSGKGVVVEMDQLWPPQQGHRHRRVEHDVQGGTQALGPGLGSAQRAVGPVTSGEQALYVTAGGSRSEEHTSELQSLMRIPYAVFC